MKISQLKKDLQNGDINSSLSYLSSAIDDSIFGEFREHKLLLISLDNGRLSELREAYRNSVKPIITNSEIIIIEINYLDFIEIYLSATNTLKKQLRSLLTNQFNLNLKSFVVHIFKQVELYSVNLQEHLYENAFGQSSNYIDPDQLSEFHGWCFNTLRGRLNDMMFAVYQSDQYVFRLAEPR